MKELSIEEKAKRFDEALKMAKECITYIPDEAVNKYMLSMFPELEESEDEKMLNQLHSWMKEFGGAEDYTEKVYTWIKDLLKKQGERPAWSEDDELRRKEAISIITTYEWILEREGKKCWTSDKVIAWLKKQGKEKETNSTDKGGDI